LPIIESLWHGRPVICGSNGAIGEVAAGGGCRLVDQNNADDLAGAIGALLRDEALYQHLYDETRGRPFRTWADYGRDLDDVVSSGGAP
jgi:glycosyltransferase involved in cell wall biosynthesis